MPPKKKTEFPCGFCKETTSSTHSIQCIICEFWHHKKCIPGMTDEYYKQVTRLKEDIGTVYWLCEKCDVFNKKMMQSMNQLTKRMETLETREEAKEIEVKRKAQFRDIGQRLQCAKSPPTT